jgi:transposase-like protein
MATIRIVKVNERGLRIGEDHQHATHTDAEIELARELHAEGVSYKQLAEKFEVSKSTIAGWIKFRRRGQHPTDWRKVEVPEVISSSEVLPRE